MKTRLELKYFQWLICALFLLGILSSLISHAQELSLAAKSYQPNAQFDVKISEAEYRKNSTGRSLIARVYEPQGLGPFPVVIDFHGGAWNNKNRTAEQPMDLALAKSGLLVVAIDLTLAPDRPYPANLQDAHYGIRWLKLNAPRWKGDPSTLGIYASSSGGHVAELIGLKPFDPEYSALVFSEAPNLDAKVRYIVSRAPISDPRARYQNAVNLGREKMINNHYTYFQPWSTIDTANPQYILDRKEKVFLPPLLVMAGEKDDNVLPEIQKRFVDSYQKAGGSAQLKIFADSDHEWVAQEGPQTDLARKTVKEFIATQLNK
jgi:acetyl esterase/lipase